MIEIDTTKTCLKRTNIHTKIEILFQFEMDSVVSNQHSSQVDNLQLAETNTMVYKVTLYGYWLNAEERIWKTPDNKLFRIDNSYNATPLDDREIDNVVSSPPAFKIHVPKRSSKVLVQEQEQPSPKRKRVI